jgi:GTP-binding protein
MHVIKASAGDGGRGCISFRREKYEPWGGPTAATAAGEGTSSSSATTTRTTWSTTSSSPTGRARGGEHGLGKDCNGKGGARRRAQAAARDRRHRPLDGPGRRRAGRGRPAVVLCKGGNGGWGNTHFKTSTNRAPSRANPGQVGEHGEFRLVLKSIADVGLVGFPNAGKSSLTNAITKAHPKTAAYPFTTLHPQIGVIEFKDEVRGDRHLLLADIPGLIEGASENRGLGHRFLRHIERCALLLIIVDMAGVDGRDPRDDYRQLLQRAQALRPGAPQEAEACRRQQDGPAGRPPPTSRSSSAATRSTSSRSRA